MQKRRVGAFDVPQLGQIRGGTTSPAGSFVPHFRQNFREGLFSVPQFVQTSGRSGVSAAMGGGGRG